MNLNYKVEQYILKDDGVFPNNENLPLLIYRAALTLPVLFPAKHIMDLFQQNGWENAWKDTVFYFQHYHSKTHEVLGVYRGSATLLFGGKNGVKVKLDRGDVVLIPAGVAHKNIDSEKNFKVVGAYPKGFYEDMKTGEPTERPKADEKIAKVPIPDSDPVFGIESGLKNYWFEN